MAKLSDLPRSARTANYGPFVPEALRLSVPVGDTKPKLDTLTAHDSRVSREEPVGFFCGSPVFTLDLKEMDNDVEREALRLVATSNGVSIPPEVLPGEVTCGDNVIRRSTTAEAVGDAFYAQLEGNVVGGRKVSLGTARLAAADGAMVTWLKDCALIHEEAACA